jgi:hypothetical protein
VARLRAMAGEAGEHVDNLELALRAFAVPSYQRHNYEPPPWTPRHADTLLVFDTETTLGPEQRLTFGCARLYRPRDTRFGINGPPSTSRFECFEEYRARGYNRTGGRE